MRERPRWAAGATVGNNAGARGPGRAKLLGAYGAVVPDLIGRDLRVLLVGVNPSLWSGLVGYHFAGPANRLWSTLHLAGFTARRLHPSETAEVVAAGLGITNLVPQATARADEVGREQLRAGVERLADLVARAHPAYVAVLGLSAYRVGFGRPRAVVGPQPERLADARLWLLPNPSGRSAFYQQPALTAAYADLHRAAFPERVG